MFLKNLKCLMSHSLKGLALCLCLTIAPVMAAEESFSCAPGEYFEPIIDPNATVASGTNGICLLCSVTNEGNVIDSNLANAARISIPVGVGGSGFIRVTDTSQVYLGEHSVGFMVENPATLIDLSLLQTITITTLLNGTVQESFTGGNLAALSVLG